MPATDADPTNPLYLLQTYGTREGTEAVFCDTSGKEIGRLPLDTPTSYRSLSGNGPLYSLDAILLCIETREMETVDYVYTAGNHSANSVSVLDRRFMLDCYENGLRQATSNNSSSNNKSTNTSTNNSALSEGPGADFTLVNNPYAQEQLATTLASIVTGGELGVTPPGSFYTGYSPTGGKGLATLSPPASFYQSFSVPQTRAQIDESTDHLNHDQAKMVANQALQELAVLKFALGFGEEESDNGGDDVPAWATVWGAWEGDADVVETSVESAAASAGYTLVAGDSAGGSLELVKSNANVSVNLGGDAHPLSYTGCAALVLHTLIVEAGGHAERSTSTPTTRTWCCQLKYTGESGGGGVGVRVVGKSKKDVAVSVLVSRGTEGVPVQFVSDVVCLLNNVNGLGSWNLPAM